MAGPTNITFNIPGCESSETSEEQLGDLLKIHTRQSVQIRPPTRGAGDFAEVQCHPAALIEIQFAGGAKRYTRADQLASDIREQSAQRGAGPLSGENTITLPTAFGSPATRGDSELLATFRVLELTSAEDPVLAEIENMGAELGAEKLAAYFEKPLKTGLHEILDPRQLGKEVTAPPQMTSDKPILLLLHGTASSTAGSFSGLAGKDEWTQFLSDYDRILTLEHRTFSVSPIQNALDAATLLPTGATLHLLSHSRGGLIGELLCLKDITSTQIDDFRKRRSKQADDLAKLAALLRAKRFKVERFVRVACPSRGTILLSDRVDLYFSLLLKVLEYVPLLYENVAYSVFKATFLKLIAMKASPEQIPGIEAMRPESPLIALLNRPDLSTQADLAIVAGRAEGFTLSWRGLAKLASDAFYREANDFVVNTESMYWGMQRPNGARYFSDQGSGVFHFNYFTNDKTRKQIAAHLSRAARKPPDLFVDLNLRLRKDLMFPEWRGEDKRPLLIYIPPALGSYLSGQQGRVWLKVPGLLPGDLDALADLDKLSADGVVGYGCQRLIEYLNSSFFIQPFAYDWRHSLTDSVTAFAQFVADLQQKYRGRQLVVLAASHGGILLQKAVELNKNFAARLLVLGSPSHAVTLAQDLLAAKSPLLKLLKLVDGRDVESLAAIFQKLPGISDLATTIPARAAELTYIFGLDSPADPADKNSKIWYAHVRDGNLTDSPVLFEAIRDLLISGTTSRLSAKPLAAVASAPVPRPLLYPSEAELFAAAFAADREPITEPPLAIEAYVRHAHLREARFPLAVGHYKNDVIVSAEKVLDDQLGGRLSNRFHMDLYPGIDGSTALIAAPACKPEGALIIGLGEIGQITAEKVRNGVTAAALSLALAKMEEAGPIVRDPISVGISSLLLGTYGGNALSVRNSIAAIVDGVVQANRTLRSRALADRVRVDRVEIIELYEDQATQAVHELVRLEDRLREYADERVMLNVTRYLSPGPGGQFHRPVDPYKAGWWRRIGISQKEGKFNFTSLSERARAEERLEARQLALVKYFVDDAIATATYDEELSSTLFELLLPNDLKDEMRDEASIVFVVDESTAYYPWELLAQRTRKIVKPLAANVGLLRQFVTPNFRVNPQTSRQNVAFVVGDPENPNAPLPQAQEEAERVANILRSTAYEVKLLNKKTEASARSILTQLFAREYRILHFAGHGQYNPRNPLLSGLLLSGNKLLTSAEVSQLRVLPELVFLNCCYLGQQSDGPDTSRLKSSQPNQLAASLARQLINLGVKAVVAAGWAVQDDAAQTFAVTFYREMIENRETFGAAVLKARQETFRHHPGSNTWGAYQCYGNPDFSLVAAEDGHTAEPAHGLPYVARQECVDRLKTIQSKASGANDGAIAKLSAEIALIESGVPPEWLDGEVLTLIGSSYGDLGDFERAVETFRRALAHAKARQSFQAVEQLANLLSRSAATLPEKKDRDERWEESLTLLRSMRSLWPSSERLSLEGSVLKRMADFDAANLDRVTAEKALAAYHEASILFQQINGKEDPYSLLNALALKLVLSNPLTQEDKQKVQEVLVSSARAASRAERIWERVDEPDALVLAHLLDGDLQTYQSAVLEKYQSVFQSATAREKDSIGKQLLFLARRLPDSQSKTAVNAIARTLGLLG